MLVGRRWAQLQAKRCKEFLTGLGVVTGTVLLEVALSKARSRSLVSGRLACKLFERFDGILEEALGGRPELIQRGRLGNQ